MAGILSPEAAPASTISSHWAFRAQPRVPGAPTGAAPARPDRSQLVQYLERFLALDGEGSRSKHGDGPAQELTRLDEVVRVVSVGANFEGETLPR